MGNNNWEECLNEDHGNWPRHTRDQTDYDHYRLLQLRWGFLRRTCAPNGRGNYRIKLSEQLVSGPLLGPFATGARPTIPLRLTSRQTLKVCPVVIRMNMDVAAIHHAFGLIDDLSDSGLLALCHARMSAKKSE